MPRNIVIRMIARMPSTLAAFLGSGGRNAGTPSVTASTPVSAVHPEEKARRIRNAVIAWPASFQLSGGGSGGCNSWPSATRANHQEHRAKSGVEHTGGGAAEG